jgi:hypothetical protein
MGLSLPLPPKMNEDPAACDHDQRVNMSDENEKENEGVSQHTDDTSKGYMNPSVDFNSCDHENKQAKGLAFSVDDSNYFLNDSSLD